MSKRRRSSILDSDHETDNSDNECDDYTFIPDLDDSGCSDNDSDDYDSGDEFDNF